MSDKAKYGYLAGIIDGEGCLSIGAGRKGNVTNYNSIIVVVSTDERLVKWLHKHFGGNYYKVATKSPRWRDAYRWRFLKKAEIEKLLLAIIPYLIIKREQAIKLLEFVRLPRYMENPEKREQLFQELKLLNKRGVDNVTTNMQDTDDLDEIDINDSVKIESELHGDMQSALGVIQAA